MTRRLPTQRLVYWFLRAFAPCTDQRLEIVLWRNYRAKPSTVRGARAQLVKRGLVAPAGRTKDGKRTLWHPPQANNQTESR